MLELQLDQNLQYSAGILLSERKEPGMDVIEDVSSCAREDSNNGLGGMGSIPLSSMPQQAEVLAPEDDWTGLSSPAARRKLQNRLNQRAYRRRRKASQLAKNPAPKTARTFPVIKPKPCNRAKSASSTAADGDGWGADPEPWDQSLQGASVMIRSASDLPDLKGLSSICDLGASKTMKLLKQLEERVYQGLMLGSPTTDNLLTLVQFNLLRSIINNIFVLGLSMELMSEEDILSPFNTLNLGRPETSLPPSLRPTMIQRTIAHHPWIDPFPIPTMRDRLLSAAGLYDDAELCNDLLGVCGPRNGDPGLIIWSEPYDPYGYEVTEDFAKKWGWLLSGCQEILESTNYWRGRRGEEPLFVIDALSSEPIVLP